MLFVNKKKTPLSKILSRRVLGKEIFYNI
jgi:hypothetical protein